MGKIKKMNFYYGAILAAILQYNPDASPTLILNDEESRQAYRILTNTSKQEYILFFKYATSKQKESKDKQYTSWLFSFSVDDKEKLKTYYEKSGFPVFICLLCLRDKLYNSEIAILKYEEYKKVLANQTITIGLEAGKHNFYLFTGNSKSRDDAYKISTTRISKKFDDLAKEVIKSNPQHFRKKLIDQGKIRIRDLVTKEIIEYPNSSICPSCSYTLKNIKISDEKISFEAKKCTMCGKIYLRKDYYEKICAKLGVQYLKNEIFLMQYPTNVKKIRISEKDRTIFSPEKTNIIYIVDQEGSECPIHHTKFQVKVINWGRGKRDTVLYCAECDKMIIDEEHKKSFVKMMNSQKNMKKYEFKRLDLIFQNDNNN